MNRSKTQPFVGDLFEVTASKDDLNRVLSAGPEASIDLGKLAIDKGHLSLAYDILKASLVLYPGHVGITYLAALALARSGSLDEASAILATVLDEAGAGTTRSIDVLSLAGRIAKDRWAQAQSGKVSLAAGEISIKSYLQAFELSGDYFPGINAATMMRLMGKNSASEELAAQIKNICLAMDDPDHWCLATLGEASVLTGDFENALYWYGRASKAAKGKFGDLASMRRQLRLIGRYEELPTNILDTVAVPLVAAFIQTPFPNRDYSFPRLKNEEFEKSIVAFSKHFSNYEIGFAYSSALCLEETLFMEEMQRQGAETSIHLPFDQKDFVDSTSGEDGTGWLDRIHGVATKSNRTEITTSEGQFGDDSLYAYTARLIGGYALLRAKHLETGLVLYTVPGPSNMNSDPAFSQLIEQAQHVEVIDPLPDDKIPTVVRESEESSGGRPETKTPPSSRSIREVRTMIFADVVGFSGFTEESTQAYVGFLNEIADILHNAAQQPLFQNTWGDGLFLVFENASEAASFSLELLDKIKNTDWVRKGMPEKTNIRIGMHTGPVFPAIDRIIGHKNFFGTHVNKAARIEPIATPGTVYVTEQCAAYIEAEDRARFSLDYLGLLPLAKGFGSYRIYRLRQRSAVESKFQ